MAWSDSEGSSPDHDVVRSVDRAAALLLALGDSRGEAGVTELARRLGLHKSTTSRLLATLARRGLVEQDQESGKYRLGVVVIRLAEQAERTIDLAGVAMPELERLSRAVQEGVAFAVLDGGAFVRVARVDRADERPAPGWTGRGSPPHALASGKVLLSALPEREVARLARRGLPRFTERTIVELEPLLEELARVRRRGYGTALGEFEDGVNAVAAPVMDAHGAVIAAVGIWGPAPRLTEQRLAELASLARAAAGAISARLGRVPA